jgi:hypothetical protein
MRGMVSFNVHAGRTSFAISTLRVKRVDDVTYLVVLDREHDKTVGVLLKEGLCGFNLLDSKRLVLGGLLARLLNGGVDGLERCVLLATRLEVELLNRGIAHLEVLEGGSSLRKRKC